MKPDLLSTIMDDMMAHDHSTKILKCPSCGKVGTAMLSRANVEFLTEGFHVGSEEGGRVTLYCSRCNVPVKATTETP